MFITRHVIVLHVVQSWKHDVLLKKFKKYRRPSAGIRGVWPHDRLQKTVSYTCQISYSREGTECD